MKKIIIIGIIIVMLTTMSMTVFAAENGVDTVKNKDSLDINKEERQLLGAEDSEKVIRVYNISICRAFARVENIDELLKRESLILSQYYLILSTDDNFRYKDIVDNVSIDLANDVPIDSRAINAFDGDILATKVSSEVEIYETYYLSGVTTHTGTAIYYKTNKGDYVYYSYYELGSGEYLFPIKDFCEYQKAIQNERDKYANSDGGVEISQLWNLSKYDIHSADFKITTNTDTKLEVEEQQSQTEVEDQQSQTEVEEQQSQTEVEEQQSQTEVEDQQSQPKSLKRVGVFVGVIILIAISGFIAFRTSKKKTRK